MRLLLISLLGLLSSCATNGSQASGGDPSTRGLAPAETESEVLANEVSVKPGINDSWRSDDIDPLIGRLETESREIYVHRGLIGAVAGPPAGSVVADVGAGSGFMSHLFSRMVGPNGKVYAVDINETMLAHIRDGAAERGLANLQTVLCGEKDVNLPPDSVDMVFICDTYHHFEYPKNTMSTIRAALRPGGQLVLVEFERIPGVTSERLMEHVRAPKEIFRKEIEDAGFVLLNEHPLEVLEENYVLRFGKK